MTAIRRLFLLTALALAVPLAACGSDPFDRTTGGAATGAATGGAIGLAFGGIGAIPGALIGAGLGAGTGAATDAETVDLGEPLWE